VLLSPFIHPEPISTGKYNTYLVKALVDRGFLVDAIAYHPIYPDWKLKRTTLSLNGVKILRGGGILPYPESMLFRRIQLEGGFMFHAFRHIFFKRNKVIFIPVFPPIIFFFFIRFLIPKTAKKIGIVHDLLSVMTQLSKSLQKGLLIKIVRLFEKSVFSDCDKLIFVSKSMAKRAINEYKLDPNKVSVCYPFMNLEKSDATNALEHLFPSDYKHIIYSGAIGEKQNPYQLLKVFQGLTLKREGVLCHIFSRGPLFEELKKSNPQRFKRIYFHDLVPEENLYELYQRSNIQIIPQKEGTSEGAIPSKLPNIISAGVPIFAISDSGSELSQIVRESGIGYCANTWDIDTIVVDLNNFLESSNLQTHYDRQCKVIDFVNQHFRIDGLIQTIIA